MPSFELSRIYTHTGNTNEVLLWEYTDDMSAIGGVDFAAVLSAIMKVSAGTATLRARIGGTIGAVDGTIAASMSTGSASFAQVSAAATTPNPTGQRLVKFTVQLSNGAATVELTGVVLELARQGGDGTPPTVTLVSPAAGLIPGPRSQAKDVPIVIQVTDLAPGILAVFVWFKQSDESEWIMVHNGAAFLGSFTGTSTRTAIANGYEYSLKRAGGWDGDNFQIHVAAIDADGNLQGSLPP